MQAPLGCEEGELGVVHLRTEDDIVELPRVERMSELHVVGSELEDLSGLECLKAVGQLFIEDNLNLRSLDGLDALTTVMVMAEDPEEQGLIFVDSEVVIRNNPELTSIAGLASLELVDGYLSIQRNARLHHLDGLQALRQVPGVLDIMENPNLESIDGLESFEGGEVHGDFGGGGLRVQDNRKLTEITLSNAPEMGWVVIIDNPALQHLNFDFGIFPAHYEVRNNPLLDRLPNAYREGRGYLRWPGLFSVIDNDMLVSLGQLPAKFGNGFTDGLVVEISENDRLVDLRGLEALEELYELWIVNNASLRSLSAIDAQRNGALTTVLEEFVITGNHRLTACETDAIATTISENERNPDAHIDVSDNATEGPCP